MTKGFLGLYPSDQAMLATTRIKSERETVPVQPCNCIFTILFQSLKPYTRVNSCECCSFLFCKEDPNSLQLRSAETSPLPSRILSGGSGRAWLEVSPVCRLVPCAPTCRLNVCGHQDARSPIGVLDGKQRCIIATLR